MLAQPRIVPIAEEIISQEWIVDETLQNDVEETRLSEVEETATTSSWAEWSLRGGSWEIYLGKEGRSPL